MIDFQQGDKIRYMPCMHVYHVHCIDAWLMRSFTCPSCMEPVDRALFNTYQTVPATPAFSNTNISSSNIMASTGVTAPAPLTPTLTPVLTPVLTPTPSLASTQLNR